MKPPPCYDRIVDAREGLLQFTLLTRDIRGHLVGRSSQRVENRAALSARVNQAKAVD